MDKLQRAVSENPIVALAGAAVAGAAIYHNFCKDKQPVTITEAAKKRESKESEAPVIVRLRSTGKPITKKDEGFKFVEWAEQLPASSQNDMQELLTALEGEIPTLSDLHFMSEDSLKNYGSFSLFLSLFFSSFSLLSCLLSLLLLLFFFFFFLSLKFCLG